MTSPNKFLNSNDTCCSKNRCCSPQSPSIRETVKIGRNDLCPCGNGRKFKKCCGK